MRVRTILALATVTLVATAFAALPNGGKMARFAFDESGNLAHDSGLTPWPGYCFRATYGEHDSGGCMVMKGETSNGLMLPNPADFFGAEAHRGAIAVWVRPDFTPGPDQPDRVICDFMHEASNTLIDGYEIAIVASKDKLWAAPAITERMIIPSPLKKGEWTHIALTWDDQVGSALYVNGKKVAERKNKFTPTPLTWWPGRFGAFTPSGAYPFAGAMDDIRLYDHPLSGDEIAALMTPTTPPLKIVTESHRFRVTNLGDAPITLHQRTWLAQDESTDLTKLWGYLPLPQEWTGLKRVYIGGPVGKLSDGDPVTIAPKQTVGIHFTDTGTYPAWARHLLLDGDQVLATADISGLTCDIDTPFVFSGKDVTENLTVRNHLGRLFSGTIRAVLVPWYGIKTIEYAPIPVTVKPDDYTIVYLHLTSGSLPVGNYHLELHAVDKQTVGELQPKVVTVLAPTNYRTAFGPAACVVSHWSRDLSLRMQADGVKALTYRSSRAFREDDDVYPYGMKLWYTPAFSANRICKNPAVWDESKALATALGRTWRDKPGVLNQVMTGESLDHVPCYCDYCNADFRAYLKAKYGTIDKLNDAWGAKYVSFDEINQLGSPKDVSAAAAQMANMQRKLPKDMAARWRELFRRDPARAMEWRRWHDKVLIDWYKMFAGAFHDANHGRTAISEQPCWPNFHSDILFALGKIADLGGMDLYLPGDQPTSLGYPAELFLNFDFNAACFRGKPLWVNELYVQNNSPAGLADAQGWFLVGRGYSMITYFTYDYYREGVRNNLPLIFGLFDQKMNPYPVYASFQKFSRDSARFNKRYDWTTLRAPKPRVAEFLGDDEALANYLETGGETWNAEGVHGANGAYWLAERDGYAVDFVNDADMADPRRLAGRQVLLVPWCQVMSEESEQNILRYADRGGTVILDGPGPEYDADYHPHAVGAGPFGALGVQVSKYEDEPNTLVLAHPRALGMKVGTVVKTRGRALGVVVTKGEVLGYDGHGQPALIRVRIGKGQVFWLLTNVGRGELSHQPDAKALALWRGMIQAAGVRPLHEVTATPDPTGKAICDVSERYRGGKEAFVFVTNFFAPTQAEVLLRMPRGQYLASDAFTDENLPLTESIDGWSFKVNMPAYGARVIRVRSIAGGEPFKGK